MAPAMSQEAAIRLLSDPLAARSGRRVRPRTFFDWEGEVVASQNVVEFRRRLFAALRRLPAGQRASALDGMLRELDPEAADMVLDETRRLVGQGHTPSRALEAAVGAVLAARRKKHWWVLFNAIIPFQAKKVAEGIHAATPDPRTRAARIDLLVRTLRPEKALPFRRSDASTRLKEMGFSAAEIAQRLRAKRVTAHDIALTLSRGMAAGLSPVRALDRALRVAMREYAIEHFMAKPVALGAEFCVVASAIIAGLGVVASVVGIGIQQANVVHAEREARRARDRQKRAPLSAGEIEQIIAGVLRSGATTWGQPQRQAAIDYLRVNRFGRVTFVEPEERNLQTAFTNARNAIIAQQRAVQQAEERKQLMVIGGVAAVLVGGALIYRMQAA